MAYWGIRMLVIATCVALGACAGTSHQQVAAPVDECPAATAPATRALQDGPHPDPLAGEPTPGVEECPEAVGRSASTGFVSYDAFVEEALGVLPTPGLLLVIRMGPSFAPERALSLRQDSNGDYVLRSARLSESAWHRMMTRMGAQQGSVIHLDETSQARALNDLRIGRDVSERYLDPATAKLLLTLWAAVLKRDQVVDTSEIRTITLDGTSYRVWTPSGAIKMGNPRGALGIAVDSAERLETMVQAPSPEDCRTLMSTIADMKDALARVRHNGPCRFRLRESASR